MTTTLKFDFTTPGLNGKDGLMRMKFRDKAKWKEKLQWLILEQTMYRHKGKVRITYHRTGERLMDVLDNLPATLKFVGDALVSCKTIAGDSPKHIPYQPVITQSIGKPSMTIIIEDID